MDKTSLGDRMKGYENAYRIKFPERTPVIIRVDGKAFHTVTRGLEKPFDTKFIHAMTMTAIKLCEEIQNCKLAYFQSDEISLLLNNYENIETQSWFGNNLQKMTSVSAGVATWAFNKHFESDKLVTFDSRAFVLPKDEVCNYFIWRQQDATRNSIQALGQSNFSHKQLNGLSCNKIQDKLMLEKNINWNNLDSLYKRGGAMIYIDDQGWCYNDVPIFTQDRNYIERYV